MKHGIEEPCDKAFGEPCDEKGGSMEQEGGWEGQGKGRGIGNTYGVQEQGVRWGRLLLMSDGTPDLRMPDGDAHCAASVVERGSVRGSRAKSELAREKLFDGLDCSSTLARPWPCDDAD